MWNNIKTAAAAAFAAIKAACFGSLTVAWSYLLELGGQVLSNFDSIAASLGDPGLTEQIKTVVKDPQMIGQWLSVVAAVTLAARLKSILFPKKA